MTVTINLDSREAFDALPDVFFWPVPTVGVWYYGETKNDDVYGAGPDPEWVKAGEPCDHYATYDDTDTVWWCGCGDGMSDEQHRDKGACETCLMFDRGEPCDGKPRITITVPCDKPGCPTGACPNPHDCCPYCADGRVVVPDVWAVIEHIGVIDGYTLILNGPPSLRLGDHMVRLETIPHPDPASLVGTFGAICRVVTP